MSWLAPALLNACQWQKTHYDYGCLYLFELHCLLCAPYSANYSSGQPLRVWTRPSPCALPCRLSSRRYRGGSGSSRWANTSTIMLIFARRSSRRSMHTLPHKRAQLLAILVGAGAQLLLQLAHHGNGVLERIFPGLECSGVRCHGRHGNHRVKDTPMGLRCSSTLQRERVELSHV